MPDYEPTAEQWYYEDLSIGDTYDIPSKTMTDTHFVLFSGLTGDFHPLHMDEHFAKEETPFGKRVGWGNGVV